jgi:hypothetical protein
VVGSQPYGVREFLRMLRNTGAGTVASARGCALSTAGGRRAARRHGWGGRRWRHGWGGARELKNARRSLHQAKRHHGRWRLGSPRRSAGEFRSVEDTERKMVGLSLFPGERVRGCTGVWVSSMVRAKVRTPTSRPRRRPEQQAAWHPDEKTEC